MVRRFPLLSAMFVVGLAAVNVAGCVTPSASHGAQNMDVMIGDRFALLNPTSNNDSMQSLDAIALTSLSNRAHSRPDGRLWLVEYSYSIRPVRIAIITNSQGYSNVSPKSDALFECAKTSHRLTLRILASDDGRQVYKGVSEVYSCDSSTAMNNIVFEQILEGALSHLIIK